jgi:hypothetical protein
VTDSVTLSRRDLLALGALVGLAGCTGDDGGATDSTTVGSAGSTSTGADARRTSTGADARPTVTDAGPAGQTDEPDLREANVVGTTVERSDGSVTFEVTLYHDDDGEDGYADWWQVESLAGERLGRRDLTHPHSTAPFTRSGTFELPESVSCVVVRGHDQTHEYGGQAVLVNLDTGAMSTVDQGSEPRPFTDRDCP